MPGGGPSGPGGDQRSSWTEASRAAWPAEARGSAQPPSLGARLANQALEPGLSTINEAMVSHSIPSRLKHGQPHTVEVRVERPSLGPVGGPSRSGTHFAGVRAIAVALRPLEGRFMIDAVSPETQWEQGGAGSVDRLSSEAAIWRFTVTPLGSGRGVLQLCVSARVLGPDGGIAVTQLPDQAYEVNISRGIASRGTQVGILVLAAAGGMVVLKLAEALLRFDIVHLARRLLGL